ncbi:MAG: hypothetical protein ABIJ18_04270 [archaeon]
MKITDSSCLICIFVEIEKPFILLNWIKRGYKIVIPHQIFKELQKNKKTFEKVKPKINEGLITLQKLINEEDIIKFRNRHPQLGKGEISVILTAIMLNKQKKRYYAVIDDKNARKIAQKYNIQLTGTYGLLKTLNDKKVISKKEFTDCKKAMQDSKFRINFDKIK